MIFDEPISHLDWDRAAEVLAIIRKHCRNSRRAALLVLHDQHFAETFCDHLLYLRPHTDRADQAFVSDSAKFVAEV
jgi:ABC-type cobalamin/Fe3+-siderophores transport system ATPase subunit